MKFVIQVFYTNRLQRVFESPLGYNSGEQSLTGVFSRIFVGLGTSYYSSENVIDGEIIRLGGSVIVALPSEQTNKIEVMAEGVAAVHLPSGISFDMRDFGDVNHRIPLLTCACPDATKLANSALRVEQSTFNTYSA